ncbi:hypothetical protein LIER_30614 [Lithospermum erythrorhizon]|uniref:Cystatin domain-containing protein n=1 Tax=Lithospermum erythrorhizon TaxID=34254 RepID=A0AAV3RU40_LITER
MNSSNVNCIFQVDESGGSSACAGCPEFLPMWQKGCGPKGGDKAERVGFDVVDYPGNSVIGAVGPAFSDMSLAMIDKKMIGFSLEALKVYNDREGTHFTLYMVLKANMQSIAGALYFITFEAIDPYDSIQVFQAKVAETLENPKEFEDLASDIPVRINMLW